MYAITKTSLNLFFDLTMFIILMVSPIQVVCYITNDSDYNNFWTQLINTINIFLCCRSNVKLLQICANMTQLHDACERGNLIKVTSLLSSKECDMNAPLHIACKCGHLEIVRVFLNNTVKQLWQHTTHLACKNRSSRIIKVLLKMRCSANISNKNGVTAQDIWLDEYGDCLLHIACQWGDVDIVRYLTTDARCDLDIQS